MIHVGNMAEGPLVEEFMRHLQAGLDEAMEIDDEIERNDRILQLEIAIQEAIIFNNRYQELVSHGIDPLVLVKQKDGEEMQQLDHSKLVPLLVKTIQELEARVKELEG